jgi:phospholipase/lecithinase/hemolysin
MMRFLSHAACAAGLAVLLTACGGGTNQVEAFVPSRVLAFGDEHSSFAAGGRKYSVNAIGATGAGIDCEAHPLWIQSVAALYGYKYAECLGSATEAKALTRAAPGATVAELKLQVDAQAAAGFTSKDLALVLVGLHDVRQIYEGRLAGETEDALIAKARQRGTDYAAQVNRMVDLGARVIVATAPDLGITPYGLAKGTTEAGLLTRLSAAFNGRMRVNILNDGRFVGLVLADELLQSAVQVPSAYGLSNVIAEACRGTAPLPNCDANTASLVDGASVGGWLWADSLRFGVTAHTQLGVVAGARAQSNPF